MFEGSWTHILLLKVGGTVERKTTSDSSSIIILRELQFTDVVFGLLLSFQLLINTSNMLT